MKTTWRDVQKRYMEKRKWYDPILEFLFLVILMAAGILAFAVIGAIDK
jgi:hypothetical protein